jgi:hypothetical protein
MEKLQKITVNTGLNNFTLVDKITHAEAQNISGIKTFSNAPVYLALESLAQLGAFHVRYLTGFEKHAFLLKITRCLMPAQERLNGTYKLSGMLVSRSVSAFSHILQAEKGDRIRIEGEFMFATVDYDRSFQKEKLMDHYRSVFSCFQNDSKTD